MIGRIHHIGIRVRDFERMVSFYRAAFGFAVVGEELSFSKDREKGGSRMVMMRADNCYIEIISTSASDGVQTPTVERGYVHISFDVADIETAFTRLQELGVSFFQPAPMDYGHVKSVSGRDPEGNVIEIQQTIHGWDCEVSRLPVFANPPA